MDLSNEFKFAGTEPIRAHEQDAGADLMSAEDVTIPAFGYATVGTGTKVEIPDGCVGLLFGRSGLGTRGIGLLNGVGVIDPGYTGEIGATLLNSNQEPMRITAGTRIAQLVVLPIINAPFARVPFEYFAEADTERGEDGFGSTGE